MIIGNYEFVFGRREKIILSVVLLAVLGVVVFFNFFAANNGPESSIVSGSSLIKISRFDSTSAAVLASPTPISAENCDIFISPPDRQIKYFDTIACGDLGNTTVTKNDLLSFGNNQSGVYALIVSGEDSKEGTIFAFAIG